MKKDVLIRAAKTFVQAFAGSFAVTAISPVTDFEQAKALLFNLCTAGVSAGICAVWNMLIETRRGN